MAGRVHYHTISKGIKLKCHTGGKKKKSCGEGFIILVYPVIEGSRHVEDKAIHTGSTEGRLVKKKEDQWHVGLNKDQFRGISLWRGGRKVKWWVGTVTTPLCWVRIRAMS